MTTTKKDIYPKKPTTKRDKHFYDLGAKEQAVVFNSNYKMDDKEWEDFYYVSNRKDFGDTEKPVYYHTRSKAIVTGILFIGAILALLFATHGDQQALQAGLIN